MTEDEKIKLIDTLCEEYRKAEENVRHYTMVKKSNEEYFARGKQSGLDFAIEIIKKHSRGE